VNIDEVVDLKLAAATVHVSQFSPGIDRYRADWDPKDLERTRQALRARATKKDGHYVEAFRVATHSNPQ